MKGAKIMKHFLSNTKVSLQKPVLSAVAGLQNLLSPVALVLGVPRARLEGRLQNSEPAVVASLTVSFPTLSAITLVM